MLTVMRGVCRRRIWSVWRSTVAGDDEGALVFWEMMPADEQPDPLPWERVECVLQFNNDALGAADEDALCKFVLDACTLRSWQMAAFVNRRA